MNNPDISFAPSKPINNTMTKKANKLLTSPLNIEKSSTLYSHCGGFNQSENCDTTGPVHIFGQTSEQQLSTGLRDARSDDDYSDKPYCRTNSKSSIPNSLSPAKNKVSSHERHLQDLHEMKTQFTYNDAQPLGRARVHNVKTLEEGAQ
jgi:hypothetical protein